MQIHNTIVFVALFYQACTIATMPSEIFTDKLTRFQRLAHELQQDNILDGEVLVVQDDNVILHEQSKARAQAGTPQFMIASLSKQFTAVMLLRALYDNAPGESEDERCNFVKLQLHQPLATFLPHTSSIWNGCMPEWTQSVTLHHLLSHTSGIPNYIKKIFDRGGFRAVQQWCRTPHTLTDQLKVVEHTPPLCTPGAEFFYSNIGYTMLVEVVTALTKMPISEYFQRVIVEPAGLTGTAFLLRGTWHDIQQASCEHLMPSYTYNPYDAQQEPTIVPRENGYDVLNALGSGSIASTVHDLAQWNRALHETRIILPPQLYELLITPHMFEYGYGLRNHQGIFNVTGKFENYTAMLIYIPDYKCSIAMLCHICEDETLVQETQQALSESLRDQIPDSNQRMDHVCQLLAPQMHKRGSARMIQFLCEEFLA